MARGVEAGVQEAREEAEEEAEGAEAQPVPPQECIDLADETRLPRELVLRFGEMWGLREPPHFKKVCADGRMRAADLAELVRSLKVSSELLCRSIARVIGEGDAASFAQFVRGYAALHARTLKEALPFAFKVFDLDGDGRLKQEEFTAVLDESMAMQKLDAAGLRKVLRSPAAEHEKVEGISFDSFRYFASLSSQTILACCGFMLHVQGFYVPLVPFGSAEEEAQEEAAERRKQRREREREYTGGVGAEGEEAREGEADASLNPFADPDFLAALEDMRTTPEERAARRKEAGNAAMKHGGKAALEQAVEEYGKGLEERCRDAALHAALLGNRAAAHTMLRNWGKALADAREALASEALAGASAQRCARRAAKAALQLGQLEEARRFHTQALALPGGDADEELAAIDAGILAGEEEGRARRVEAEAAKLMEAELAAAVRRRRLVVRDFEDERIREQCVGGTSGARVWYDAVEDELHWPVLLLYPEAAMSDFIQDVSESECMAAHLLEMFGADAENSPEWDKERKYRAADLQMYVDMPRAGEREVVETVRTDLPLLQQLIAKQARGYGIPGIPMLHVLVRGSEYEKRFFLDRVQNP